MKPVGVILDFDNRKVEYVTPGKAAKAGSLSRTQVALATPKTSPPKPAK